MEIWHNPRCSKSRQTLALIEAAGVTPAVRLYLDDPPSATALAATLQALRLQPWQVVRKKEARAKELGIADWPQQRQRWIDAMVANPVLIERPIVIAGDGRAVIGRPPENVNDLL
jgi:arsenate reductase